jgi:hypothetical protein
MDEIVGAGHEAGQYFVLARHAGDDNRGTSDPWDGLDRRVASRPPMPGITDPSTPGRSLSR